MVARTVGEVIAGEAVHGKGRYEDMLAVASVIANRAQMLGVSPQQVVANKREFNAYGSPLPKGANRYVDMADRAMREVLEKGPTHRGTFYATPKALGNLPPGLRQVTRTHGHVYYDDPQRRPINTAVGTRRYQATPAPIQSAYAPTPKPTGALAAIDRAIAPRSIPTPTAAPRGPVKSLPAEIGGRVLAAPKNVPTPTTRPASRSYAAPDASRFGTPAQPAMTQDVRNRLAETYGIKGGRVPAPSVSASTIARPSARPSYAPPSTLTAAQARNLADRLTPQTSLAMAPRPTSAPRSVSVAAPAGVARAASLPAGLQPAKGARVTSAPPAASLADRLGTFTPTRTAASLRTSAPISVGSVLGISPAAAATRTQTTAPVSRPSAPVSAAPARTNFAGPAGSPRSVDGRLNAQLNAQVRSVNPMASQAPNQPKRVADFRSSVPGPISSPAPHLSMAASPLRSLPTPTSRPQVQGPVRPQVQGPMRPASVAAPAPSRIATPTARPSVSALAAAPRLAPSVPSRVAAPTTRPTISAPTSVAPISSRPVSRTVAAPTAPRTVATPTARDPWGNNLRTGVTAAPAAPATGIGARLGISPSRLAGSLIGGAIAGPIGAIAGGWLGGRLGPAPAARVGPAAISRPGPFGGGGMNGGSMGGFGGGMGGRGSTSQGSSLNGAGIGGGMADRYGGFRGFSGDSSSTPGPDGGKVGGSSRSSSGSGGKSSSGGKGKK